MHKLIRKIQVLGRRRARLILARVMRLQKERADRYVLERLDTHTLRDIGLEAWNSELAQHVADRRRREQNRLTATHIGAY